MCGSGYLLHVAKRTTFPVREWRTIHGRTLVGQATSWYLRNGGKRVAEIKLHDRSLSLALSIANLFAYTFIRGRYHIQVGGCDGTILFIVSATLRRIFRSRIRHSLLLWLLLRLFCRRSLCIFFTFNVHSFSTIPHTNGSHLSYTSSTALVGHRNIKVSY